MKLRMSKRELEREIEGKIRARAKAMQWRPGFEQWVQGRIWQEKYRNSVVTNIRRYVPNWEQAVILDLGSGMGGTVVRLQQEGLKSLGIDFSLDYCIIARLRGMRYGLHIQVINAQGEHLPLKDRCVDVILCYEVIEHVFDPIKLLQEMSRIIKPTGTVFITVPSRLTPYDHHFHIYGISYLPRTIADWLVEHLGRDKGDDLSAGVQKLSAMHYFTLRSFLSLCNKVKFSGSDIMEDRIADYALRVFPVPRVIRLIAKLGLIRLAYRIYRCTFIHGWHFILKPNNF